MPKKTPLNFDAELLILDYQDKPSGFLETRISLCTIRGAQQANRRMNISTS
jgi:hypothetical protein